MNPGEHLTIRHVPGLPDLLQLGVAAVEVVRTAIERSVDAGDYRR